MTEAVLCRDDCCGTRYPILLVHGTGFQGPWRGVGRRGVSHMDLIDFRRRPLRSRGQTWDIVDAYVQMVAELKQAEDSGVIP